jgi:MinD superfamily P-loop ATPase
MNRDLGTERAMSIGGVSQPRTRRHAQKTSPLRIAVASGKGGTGKTTIATNLAFALARQGTAITYADCDVEEPNGHIFLEPAITERREVSIPVPEVDRDRCTLCGACATACRHSAIVVLPESVLTFPRLCHGCGGCSLACPTGAIREVPRATGVVERGASGPIDFVRGVLDVGEAMAPPVIRAVLEALPHGRAAILDAPPGTSCPVIETVKSADVVLLVTEPTPFGLNDLKLAVEMLRRLARPFGVAVNRAGLGDSGVRDYCSAEGIPVLLELPDSRAVAAAYSRGQLAVAAVPELEPLFTQLHEQLMALARSSAARPVEARRLAPRVEALQEAAETLSFGVKRDVPELVVISGKGGTGKTSIAASLFTLADAGAIADCDVDAADLHLLLNPAVLRRSSFSGGSTAEIDSDLCARCAECLRRCRFGAIHARPGGAYEVDELECEGCGVCVDGCPEGAATLVRSTNGEWFVSHTDYGPMVHARLGVAQANSGKLVSLVRRQARAEAASKGRELLICDGSPGIGCPVIASIAGARLALIVTEPTLSGLHDLDRVADLCRQLRVRAAVCVNKADINPELSNRIEAAAAARNIPVLGRVRYDHAVTAAQVDRLSVVARGEGPAATDIRALWERVRHELVG